jgi:MipA family protein
MDTTHSRILLATALAVLAHISPVFADDDCKSPSGECVPVGGWNFSLALGAGVRTDPVEHEGTIPLVVIPHISYYGERFFLEPTARHSASSQAPATTACSSIAATCRTSLSAA